MKLPGDTVGLLEGITTTRTIRRFSDVQIPDEALATMLFAATRAPSMANSQPFRFIVLRDSPCARECKEALGEAARTAWREIQERRAAERHVVNSSDMANLHGRGAVSPLAENFEAVPVVVLACSVAPSDDASSGSSIYPACQNLLLAARALGYGGVLSGFHRYVDAELRTVLGIPDSVFIAATIALGTPLGHHGPVRRHPLRHFVYEDGWESPPDWAVDPDGARFVGDQA